ncbi:MAG: aminoglycoside 6-adenylyltransferase [Lachnospiraceae bacterium]|nr:aminoglycoside 6-adenylyltransferase [Lachnospiraceae bacterium]
MNQNLVAMFEKIVTAVKADKRCKGGWHYGSVGRGEADEWSDYDPIFLVGQDDFESFSKDAAKYIANVCDELVIHWAEDYNNDCFKNFCSIVRLGNDLRQFDFFILNADRPDDWMCRNHCKGCTRENIFFDRTGETAIFLDKGYRTDNYITDTLRTIDTYWFHIQMLVKYFKRRDFFKLYKNIHDFIFQAHVGLLLSHYDTLDWGPWETKVKLSVPDEMQKHLLVYFTMADFTAIAESIMKGMAYFEQDARAICKAKGLTYPENMAVKVAEYFKLNIACDDVLS